MSKIDIDNKYFYEYDKPIDRTRKRLQELIDMGCEEIGAASFGVPGIVSGLYIEVIWSHNDEKWNDYINWMKDLIKEKS